MKDFSSFQGSHCLFLALLRAVRCCGSPGYVVDKGFHLSISNPLPFHDDLVLCLFIYLYVRVYEHVVCLHMCACLCTLMLVEATRGVRCLCRHSS